MLMYVLELVDPVKGSDVNCELFVACAIEKRVCKPAFCWGLLLEILPKDAYPWRRYFLFSFFFIANAVGLCSDINRDVFLVIETCS